MNAKEIQQYLSAYRKESKESFIDNLIANPIPKAGRTYRPAAAPAPSAAPAALPARPVGDIGKLDWFTKYIAEPVAKKPSTGKVYTPSFGKKLSDSTIPVKNSIKGAVSAVLNAAKNNPKTAIAVGAVPLVTAAAVGTKKHLDNKAAEAAAAERIKKMAFGAGAGVGAGAVGAGVTAVGLAYLLYRAMKKKNRA
jgi:hypothetical protein